MPVHELKSTIRVRLPLSDRTLRSTAAALADFDKAVAALRDAWPGATVEAGEPVVATVRKAEAQTFTPPKIEYTGPATAVEDIPASMRRK